MSKGVKKVRINSMKIEQIALLLFLIFLIILTITSIYKEQFINQACQTNTDCKSCADSSGCSWCPSKNACIQSKSRSTDECNQMNTISSSSECYSDENYISEKPKPPNVYTVPSMEYSNETVMAEMKHIKHDMTHFKHELPRIITNTMQNSMKPLLIGALLNDSF